MQTSLAALLAGQDLASLPPARLVVEIRPGMSIQAGIDFCGRIGVQKMESTIKLAPGVYPGSNVEKGFRVRGSKSAIKLAPNR